MKMLSLGTIFVFMGLAGSAAAQKCRPPRHAKIPRVAGQSYDRARKKFIAAGWKPFQTNDESTAETNLRFGNGPLYWKEKHYLEVTACGGANPGCEFIYKDKFGNQLYVYTHGLDDAAKHTFAKVTRYRIICEWEFK